MLTRYLFAVLVAATSPPLLGGVDPSPIDDLMEMVDEEAVTDEPRTPPSPPRSAVNKTEQPTVVTDPTEPNQAAAAGQDQVALPTEVKVGARQFALAEGCHFMQVYRVATDSDFTDTLALVKYRAGALGAEYVTVLFHREGGVHTLVQSFLDATYLLRSGTAEPVIRTVMAVEMYDCAH